MLSEVLQSNKNFILDMQNKEVYQTFINRNLCHLCDLCDPYSFS